MQVFESDKKKRNFLNTFLFLKIKHCCFNYKIEKTNYTSYKNLKFILDRQIHSLKTDNELQANLLLKISITL